MKHIAVIGSINMDMTAAAERIPRPGETVSAASVRYLPGAVFDHPDADGPRCL